MAKKFPATTLIVKEALKIEVFGIFDLVALLQKMQPGEKYSGVTTLDFSGLIFTVTGINGINLARGDSVFKTLAALKQLRKYYKAYNEGDDPVAHEAIIIGKLQANYGDFITSQLNNLPQFVKAWLHKKEVSLNLDTLAIAVKSVLREIRELSSRTQLAHISLGEKTAVAFETYRLFGEKCHMVEIDDSFSHLIQLLAGKNAGEDSELGKNYLLLDALLVYFAAKNITLDEETALRAAMDQTSKRHLEVAPALAYARGQIESSVEEMQRYQAQHQLIKEHFSEETAAQFLVPLNTIISAIDKRYKTLIGFALDVPYYADPSRYVVCSRTLRQCRHDYAHQLGTIAVFQVLHNEHPAIVKAQALRFSHATSWQMFHDANAHCLALIQENTDNEVDVEAKADSVRAPLPLQGAQSSGQQPKQKRGASQVTTSTPSGNKVVPAMNTSGYSLAVQALFAEMDRLEADALAQSNKAKTQGTTDSSKPPVPSAQETALLSVGDGASVATTPSVKKGTWSLKHVMQRWLTAAKHFFHRMGGWLKRRFSPKTTPEGVHKQPVSGYSSAELALFAEMDRLEAGARAADNKANRKRPSGNDNSQPNRVFTQRATSQP